MSLIINKKVELNYSADKWQLYTASMNCDEAAQELNKAFTEAVNSGLGKLEVYKSVEAVMRKYDNFGATDSEPRWVLEDLIRKVFGEKE